MSDIKKGRTENFIKAYKEAKEQSFITESINKDFFFEFADCLIARIKELEETLLKVKDKNTTLFITCRNSIPKQKVKEKLERIEDYFDRLNGPDEDIEYIRNIKKELLEDK